MNVRERLLAALAGQEPDRMPITLYGVYPYSVGDWRASRPSYRPLLDLAREETDPFCQWNIDQGTFYSRVPSTTRTLEDGAFVERRIETPLGPLTCITNTSPATQWIKKFYLQDDDDIQRFLSIPYEPVRPDLRPVLALDRSVGERALMCTAFLDGLGVVADLFTPEEFAIRCITQRRTIRGMIEKVSEQLLRLSRLSPRPCPAIALHHRRPGARHGPAAGAPLLRRVRDAVRPAAGGDDPPARQLGGHPLSWPAERRTGAHRRPGSRCLTPLRSPARWAMCRWQRSSGEWGGGCASSGTCRSAI